MWGQMTAGQMTAIADRLRESFHVGNCVGGGAGDRLRETRDL